MKGDERSAHGASGRMVVAVRAAGTRRTRGTALKAAYLDDDGELPDVEQQARIRGYVLAMFREATGSVTEVRLDIRSWHPDDGPDLVDWPSALRRWAAKDGLCP